MLVLPALAAAETKLVTQNDRRFDPERIEMSVRATLRIDNTDAFLHHVYVKHPDFEFDSGGRKPGQSVELRFPKPGTYEVLCDIHPKMRLVVEVK